MLALNSGTYFLPIDSLQSSSGFHQSSLKDFSKSCDNYPDTGGLRRRSDLHRAAVHRAAADTTLKPKDGYAVRAILPRPERPGLSRTGSGVFCDDAYGAEDGQDSNHQNGPDANDDNIIERTPSADSRGLNRSHPISFPQEKLPRLSRLSLFSFRI